MVSAGKIVFDQPGQPEVENFDAAFGQFDPDVRRLNIAMNEPGGMDGDQALGGLLSNANGLRDASRDDRGGANLRAIFAERNSIAKNGTPRSSPT